MKIKFVCFSSVNLFYVNLGLTGDPKVLEEKFWFPYINKKGTNVHISTIQAEEVELMKMAREVRALSFFNLISLTTSLV